MEEIHEVGRPNLTFFGNNVGTAMLLDEIKVYLDEVHNFIRVTNINLNSNKINGLDVETLETLQYHFEHTQGEILRKSIVISIIIILESEIAVYCDTFKRFKNIAVSFKDFRGDLLDRFKLFSIKLLSSDFDFQSSLWQNIVGLYEIRNSLVHNSGSVSGFGKRKTIENFVKRNNSFSLDDNDQIIITHQGCLDSIQIVEKFFDEITEFAFRVFPEKFQPSPQDLEDFPF